MDNHIFSQFSAINILIIVSLCAMPVYGMVYFNSTCPSNCTCAYVDIPWYNETGYYVNCSNVGLWEVPSRLPSDAVFLDLRHNHISEVEEYKLSHLQVLWGINLRGNPTLDEIPLLSSMKNLSRVLVDRGSTCCIYEMDWDKLQRYKPWAECIATIPYEECDHNLINWLTLFIYAIVFFFSSICNPWIIAVTCGVRRRRRDPILFNQSQFSISNVFVTIYAAVLFVYGIKFYGNYPRHMEAWLENGGCGIVGFFLITATLASSIFYMVEVISIFLKLRYPLHQQKHLTTKKLLISIGVIWSGAILIGAIPFMTRTRYNAVGSCLPFYAGNYESGFKFVILFTVITNTTLVTNVTLALLLLKSFIKNRKERIGNVPKKLLEENLAVEKMILWAVATYLLIGVVDLIFLIMSCTGGRFGKIGREWFARLCVLEAVTGPLVGPIRKKRFYKDTKRLLEEWHCVKRSPYDRHSSTVTLTQRKASNSSKSHPSSLLGSVQGKRPSELIALKTRSDSGSPNSRNKEMINIYDDNKIVKSQEKPLLQNTVNDTNSINEEIAIVKATKEDPIANDQEIEIIKNTEIDEFFKRTSEIDSFDSEKGLMKNRSGKQKTDRASVTSRKSLSKNVVDNSEKRKSTRSSVSSKRSLSQNIQERPKSKRASDTSEQNDARISITRDKGSIKSQISHEKDKAGDLSKKHESDKDKVTKVGDAPITIVHGTDTKDNSKNESIC